jgi:hypothetical protein
VPAQSLYALPDEQNPGGKPTLSYLLALRIEVTMKEGKVANVRADSAVHGLYLRPDTARASGARTAQTARVRNR